LDKKSLLIELDITRKVIGERIATIERLDLNKVYFLKHSPYGGALIRIKTFNKWTARCKVLASRVVIQDSPLYTKLVYSYGTLKDAVEVASSDYPLYVGWKWVSPEFERLLKGARP
jgi:hypothetical protein